MSSLLAKNTFYLTVAAIGQKIIAFVYFLFLARILQPENTGVYFLSTSLITIFSVIADFGITPVVIREIAKNNDQAATIIRNALGTKIPFICVAVLAAILSSFVLGYDPIVIQLVILASLVLVIDSLHLLFYGALRGVQKLQFEAIGVFAGQIMTVMVGGISLIFFPSLYLLVIALIAGSSMNLFVSVRKAIEYFGIKVVLPNWNTLATKKLLKIALPFALAAVFVKVYSYIDSIFISKFLGTIEVGLYSIAYKFTYAFQFLPLAFIAALYPGLSANITGDQVELKRMFMRGMWYMLILAVPIVLGLWAIAPEAVVLAGDNYAPSEPVLRVLIFVLIPIFLDFPIGSLLNAADRQTTKTVIMGVTMLFSVVLNAILIPYWGMVGAAIAALISFTVMFLAGLFFVHKIIFKFSYWELIRMSFLVVCSGLVMLAVTILIKPFVGWVGVIPLAATTYIFSLFIFGAIKTTDFRAAFSLFRP